MKKLVPVFLALILGSVSLPAQENLSLSGPLQLNASLQEIMADFGNQPPQVAYLLRLNILGVRISDPIPASFKAEVRAIEAFWPDRLHLVSLPAILLLEGPSMAERIATTTSDEPGILSPNREFLVLVRLVGSRSEHGTLVPVFEVLDIRRN